MSIKFCKSIISEKIEKLQKQIEKRLLENEEDCKYILDNIKIEKEKREKLLENKNNKDHKEIYLPTKELFKSKNPKIYSDNLLRIQKLCNEKEYDDICKSIRKEKEYREILLNMRKGYDDYEIVKKKSNEEDDVVIRKECKEFEKIIKTEVLIKRKNVKKAFLVPSPLRQDWSYRKVSVLLKKNTIYDIEELDENQFMKENNYLLKREELLEGNYSLKREELFKLAKSEYNINLTEPTLKFYIREGLIPAGKKIIEKGTWGSTSFYKIQTLIMFLAVRDLNKMYGFSLDEIKKYKKLVYSFDEVELTKYLIDSYKNETEYKQQLTRLEKIRFTMVLNYYACAEAGYKYDYDHGGFTLGNKRILVIDSHVEKDNMTKELHIELKELPLGNIKSLACLKTFKEVIYSKEGIEIKK